jgi:hypothetical protein
MYTRSPTPDYTRFEEARNKIKDSIEDDNRALRTKHDSSKGGRQDRLVSRPESLSRSGRTTDRGGSSSTPVPPRRSRSPKPVRLGDGLEIDPSPHGPVSLPNYGSDSSSQRVFHQQLSITRPSTRSRWSGFSCGESSACKLELIYRRSYVGTDLAQCRKPFKSVR